MLDVIRRSRSYWAGRPRPPTRGVEPATPRRNGTVPGACARPGGEAIDEATLRVTWEAVEEDGGDEVYKYEVQMALVDPIRPEDELEYKGVYEGLERWNLTLGSLLADNECVTRVTVAVTCVASVACHACRTALVLRVSVLAVTCRYVFRVCAHNSRGAGAWSEELRLVTNDEAEAVLVEQSEVRR